MRLPLQVLRLLLVPLQLLVPPALRLLLVPRRLLARKRCRKLKSSLWGALFLCLHDRGRSKCHMRDSGTFLNASS